MIITLKVKVDGKVPDNSQDAIKLVQDVFDRKITGKICVKNIKHNGWTITPPGSDSPVRTVSKCPYGVNWKGCSGNTGPWCGYCKSEYGKLPTTKPIL